ncbi:MAG: hypothetical protein M0Q87_15205, partial [Ottowia sp.]|nr:hypothetical protein [Ottowia sp.]
MADNRSRIERAKTLKELNAATSKVGTESELFNIIESGKVDELQKFLEKIAKSGADANKIVGSILNNTVKLHDQYKTITNKDLPEYVKAIKALGDFIDNNTKKIEKQKKVQESINKALGVSQKYLENMVKSNKEIYETSHKMQLEGNVTWKEFTKMYDNAYKSARDMNREIGKQLFTARELVGVQEKLITQGWKGLDATTLGNVTASMALLTRTMGNVDDRLIKAFEGSYKQFGDSTGYFIERLGDRLNNFSDSFGMTVGMLQGAVAEMMSSNTFLARNNMQAQLRANESLMQATALISQVGIETTGFMNVLSRTAQYGTAEQMGGIFQTGALLQDFSSGDFQSKLRGQDYAGATQDLIGSIYQTLNSMEEGYLRNQYMQMIGQGFGLSQDDLLEIMTHGGQLDEYAIEIQEKLAESQGSMEQELKDLHMDLKQRFDNWWENSGISQGIGKVLNETGLYGLTPAMFVMQGKLNTIISNQFAGLTGKGTPSAGGGILNTIAGSFKDSKGNPLTGMQGLGRMAGGLGIAGVTNVGGHALQTNTSISDAGAHTGAALLNILGGVGGGVLAGSAFGAPGMIAGGIIGGVAGITNTIVGANERKKLKEAQEDERRVARRQQAQ